MSRVLLVEDESDLLSSAAKLLRAAGYDVAVTKNGGDALCLLNSKPPPDVLVLDMVIPGLNGHQVIKKLGPSSPPVIVTTGEAMDLEDFDGGKVVRVLNKPYTARDLMGAVEDALHPSGLRGLLETEPDCPHDAPSRPVVPPSPPMTDEQRDKAHERFRRHANGGAAQV